MIATFENNILFDDTAILKAGLGEDYLSITFGKLGSDCDCTSYTSVQDDDNINSPQGNGTAS